MDLFETVKSILGNNKIEVEKGEIILEEYVNESKNIEIAKDLISKRYERINTDRRRPSLEYLSSDDILKIFINFVENKEMLLRMNSYELQDLYNKWYENIYMKSLV